MLKIQANMKGQMLMRHRPAKRIRFLALGAISSTNNQPSQDGIEHRNAGGYPKQQSEAVHCIP